MTAWAVYNEIEPYCAEWLRNQIAAGLIAPGVVDERSIEDVCPDDYREFTQVHLFAGLGGWSHALRGVGWPDDWPIWSASCPCQPFSAAGKGDGFADERHLWPAVYHLQTHLRPERIVGEQVASPDGLAWLDLVQADLAGADYAGRVVDTCAAGFGSPNLRQRLYWDAMDLHARHGFLGEPYTLGDAGRARGGRNGRTILGAQSEGGGQRSESGRLTHELIAPNHAHRLADDGRTGRPVGIGGSRGAGESGGWVQGAGAPAGRGGAGALGNAPGPRREGEPDRGRPVYGSERTAPQRTGGQSQRLAATPGSRLVASATSRGLGELRSETWAGRGGHLDGGGEADRPGPTNGFWAAADWLHCRDGKWRPVEPESFCLVDGYPNRSPALKALGNAINLEQAKGFLRVALAAE